MNKLRATIISALCYYRASHIPRKAFKIKFSSVLRHQLTKFLSFLFILNSTGCKKLINIDPPNTSINGANVYNTDATAAAVLTGLYTKMTSTLRSGGLASMTLFPSLSADELILFGGPNSNMKEFFPYYANRLTASTTGSIDFSANIYPVIYIINSAIEGLNNSNGLTESVKRQLLGEAKFMRSLCYFYLVNLYGDVPLAITTDYTINSVLPRTAKSKVYEQIISDLKDAEELLSDAYLAGNITTITKERVRPNKWAAVALLARTYLYNEDWENADKEATSLINNSNTYGLNSLDEAFLMNSKETIWALQPTLDPIAVSNTEDAKLFVLPPSGPTTSTFYPVYLSRNVIKSFENGDQRKTNWIDSVVVTVGANSTTYYFPYKYKVSASNASVSEYTIVLRLSEQYLIRSEARTHIGDINGALYDLNAIRTRAGLPLINTNTKETILTAIQHERQVELFTEWGHRWFDLKRTKKINEVMTLVTPQKGGVWNPNLQLFPFRDLELARDPYLTQNEGY